MDEIRNAIAYIACVSTVTLAMVVVLIVIGRKR